MAQHNFRFQGKFVITGILECVTGTRIGGTQEKFEIVALTTLSSKTRSPICLTSQVRR
jgi:CRISPR/Cas system CSM-associated protein Csm3 (group 7 of RAMP superfamily)